MGCESGGKMTIRIGLIAPAGCLAVISLIFGPGCETAVQPATDGPVEAVDADEKPSPWRTVDGSPQLALDAEADDQAMQAAFDLARKTAVEARWRWVNSTPSERENWAIKWAAPTVDGGVEYVWVVPVAWSPFRIEGRLASPVQNELLCGKNLDEFVGFPIEELADWLFLREGEINGYRDGGFTVILLEDRYGTTRLPEVTPAVSGDASSADADTASPADDEEKPPGQSSLGRPSEPGRTLPE